MAVGIHVWKVTGSSVTVPCFKPGRYLQVRDCWWQERIAFVLMPPFTLWCSLSNT